MGNNSHTEPNTIPCKTTHNKHKEKNTMKPTTNFDDIPDTNPEEQRLDLPTQPPRVHGS